MATRSSIALLASDATVETVYCHSDGYLEHVGKILDRYYRSPWKTRMLIEGGNISRLEQKISTKGEHSFDKPAERTTVFYRRDRGVEQPWHDRSIEYESVREWISATEESGIEFYYLGIPVRCDGPRRNTYVQNYRMEWLYTPAAHLQFHYVAAALDAEQLVDEKRAACF